MKLHTKLILGRDKNKQIFITELLDSIESYKENMLYEAIIETIVPLGPEPMQKHFEEIETDDPIEYVKTHCKFPIMEIDENRFGEKVITCGDGSGYVTRYIFSE